MTRPQPGARLHRYANVLRGEIPVWFPDAACRGRTDAMFGPPAEAKAICLTCAVHDECRSWSLSRPDPVPGGVAGGLDYRQRGQIRQRLRGAGTADRGICSEVN